MTFFTQEFFIQVVASLLGAVAFAVIFKTHVRHLPYVAIAGLMTYAIYYVVEFFLGDVFLAAFLSTLFTALFSELCARWRRAPTAVFLFPGVIPTVPGGALYYTMRYLISDQTGLAFSYLLSALKVGLGIAGGIMVVSIVVGQITDYKRKRFMKELERKNAENLQ